jgi:hypothetical protein
MKLTLVPSKLGPLLLGRESDGDVVLVHDFLDIFSVPTDDLSVERFRQVERCFSRQFVLKDSQCDRNARDAVTSNVQCEQAVTCKAWERVSITIYQSQRTERDSLHSTSWTLEFDLRDIMTIFPLPFPAKNS